MIFSSSISATFNTRCQLGEGAYYSSITHQAYWVDIKGKALFCMDWCTRDIQRFTFDMPVCWVTEQTNGTLLVGFARSIERIDPASWTRTRVVALTDEPPNNRLNDAKVDHNGRLFFGTMDDNECSATGSLYRLNQDLTYSQVDTGYVVSNGPAVSPCGTWLYSVASDKGVIYRFRLANDGTLNDRQPLVTFDLSMGVPDGITTDSEGRLWVAAWGGAGIYCFSATGNQLGFIALPALQVTSVTFAGDGLDKLLVTSATTGLSSDALKAYPQSGNTFVIDVSARGVCAVPAACRR